MRVVVHELLVPEAVAKKLGRRGISAEEARQLIHNDHKVTANRRRAHHAAGRRMMFGETDGGRRLTLVIEPTLDPSEWVIVTGWDPARQERRMGLI